MLPEEPAGQVTRNNDIQKNGKRRRHKAAKLLISKQLSEAWLVELKKFDSKQLRLVVN